MPGHYTTSWGLSNKPFHEKFVSTAYGKRPHGDYSKIAGRFSHCPKAHHPVGNRRSFVTHGTQHLGQPVQPVQPAQSARGNGWLRLNQASGAFQPMTKTKKCRRVPRRCPSGATRKREMDHDGAPL